MKQLIYLLTATALLSVEVAIAEILQFDKRSEFEAMPDRASDRIPIIVRSKRKVVEQYQMSPESEMDSVVGRRDSRQRLKELTDRHFSELMGRLSHQTRAGKHSKFRNPRLRSMRVNPDDLNVLLSSPDVEVYPNRYHKPALNQSVPLVFPNHSAAGFDGDGISVAILDTGVSLQHEFLSGAVNNGASACFSNDNGAGVGASLCPDGAGSVIGVGAGEACDSSIPACQHGTQVAGIIAGAGSGMAGVASGASIVPIQIFTRYSDPTNAEHITACGNISLVPCVRALTSDMIRALEYVGQIKTAQNIGAVNISFGTGPYQGRCDNSAAKSVIDAISAGGTAVIASSGNDGNANEITSPACISSVIAVASADISDTASWFNNRSSELDFFAPGENINSSLLPVNSYSDMSGTSAAAAHVSGAWAVLKEKNPEASVATVKSALQSTGIAVTQNSFTKPRINIEAALAVLAGGVVRDEELCIPIKTPSGKFAIICL